MPESLLLPILAGAASGIIIGLVFVVVYTRRQERAATGVLAAARAEADRLRQAALREAESGRAAALLEGKMEAIRPLREAGLKVKDVLVLIDREGGGREELASQGLNLYSVFRLRELMTILHQHNRITTDQQSSVERFIEGPAEMVG